MPHSRQITGLYQQWPETPSNEQELHGDCLVLATSHDFIAPSKKLLSHADRTIGKKANR